MAEPAYTPSYLPKQSGKKKLWITADEHYQHNNIIKYCKRPFANAEEMGAALRDKHNAVVGPEDSVLHVGDFTMSSNIDYVLETIQALNGKHYFMQGNHDMWLYELANAGELGKIRLLPQLLDLRFNGEKIVVCHYAMMTWNCAHHGALHFYGHSHGTLAHPGAAIDIGVDCHNYAPILIEDAIELAAAKRYERSIKQPVI